MIHQRPPLPFTKARSDSTHRKREWERGCRTRCNARASGAGRACASILAFARRRSGVCTRARVRWCDGAMDCGPRVHGPWRECARRCGPARARARRRRRLLALKIRSIRTERSRSSVYSCGTRHHRHPRHRQPSWPPPSSAAGFRRDCLRLPSASIIPSSITLVILVVAGTITIIIIGRSSSAAAAPAKKTSPALPPHIPTAVGRG